MQLIETDITILPTDLFAAEREASESTRWWVLHTKPRAEKVIAKLLAAKNVSYFLPLYTENKRVQRRTVTYQLPLFPGYVFLRGGDQERLAAFETKRIASCLAVEDQAGMDRDLFRIHASIQSGLPLKPEERIHPGTPAEIVSGPLAGHQGIVLRSGKNFTFVIEVNFLQRGASIEVDSSMIRPVS